MKQKVIFISALKLWKSNERNPLETVEEYIQEALEGEFEQVDLEYYDCKSDMIHYSKEILDKHKDKIFNFI